MGKHRRCSLSRAKRLELRYLHNLTFVWNVSTLIRSLEYLEEEGCRKLESIFSPAVITSVPQLMELLASDCEELEEIISLDDGDDKQRQECFPRLNILQVTGCNKLKCLFPVSMAGDFPKLTSVYIRDCSKLEKVFAGGSEALDAGLHPRLWFQALKSLMIDECPNFSSTTLAMLGDTLDTFLWW